MDDDPEPTYDQMIVESHETNDTLLSFGEQKCATDINEESPLESGDIGPAVDPENPKKSVPVKDLQVQTESKTSIFRRKEWMDQSQQVDLPSSLKSSTSSVRKPSRRSSQRLLGQESRRSSQQSAGQLPPLSQKPSRAQATNEVDPKDPIWVSQRTGKLMKSRCQQTSLVWERKTLSEILCPSSESVPGKEEESEFTTTEDGLTSSGETAKERFSGPESCLGSKQPERRESKPGSQEQFERFGSRRGSQQWNELPSSQGSKSSWVHSPKGMDPDEDVAWISQRTGREMKCQAQQTSQVWDPRAVSSFFCSSRKSSQVGQEESGFSITDEVTSSAETGMEEPTTLESCYSSQPEGNVSKHTSWQQLGSSEACRNSQRPMEQPCSLSPNSSHEEFVKEGPTEEQPFWISQRTGRGMTCKSQQTSLIWENKTLSDVLHVYSKASEASEAEEEDYSEDEEGEPKTEQEILEDADPHLQSLEEDESSHDSQQVEEQTPDPCGRTHKTKVDRAQQTDSAESVKKELADSTQQTDISEGVKMNPEHLPQDPGQGSEPTDVEGSRQSSQELVRQDSGGRCPPPERRDSQRSRQSSLRSTTEAAEDDEPKVPSDIESEPFKLTPKASCVEAAEETTWVSRKTGRTVKNQGQQTDRSWLQYFATKSKKLKRCISQQTDESFLQRYKTGKQALRKNHTEPDICRCSLCGDLYGEPFPMDPDVFSSFSTMSILSTISSQEAARAENAEEQELSPRRGDEEQPQMQQPLPWESQRGSQQAGGTEAPNGADRESRRGSLQAADDQNWAKWAEGHESNTASENSLLYTEGDDKIQQTYSLISFEDGIWLNRNTGKLLITHSQQTSETVEAEVSGTALEKSESTTEDGPAPTEVDDGSTGENRDIQPLTEVDVQPPSGQVSRRGSQQDPDGESPLLQTQPPGGDLQSSDEAQKMACIRLSEATLLSVESPDTEDGPVQIYSIVPFEEGSWMNLKTGKFLASQSQQTEASSPQSSTEEGESSKAPSQKLSEEGLVDIL